MKYGAGLASLMLLMLLAWFAAPAMAQNILSPRLQIGIRLLPSIITANKTLAANSDSKQIPVYLVFRDNEYLARQLKASLSKIEAIRGRPLDIIGIRYEDLLAVEPPRTSVIFIAEALDEKLPEMIHFSGLHKILLFSPFKGDVERGVATGFQVTDKVLPAVNMSSLKESRIELKAFFLRIAVKHD